MISNLEKKPYTEVIAMLERLAKEHDLLLSSNLIDFADDLWAIATEGDSMKTTYAIKNTENKNLYWSNTDGWVSKDFDLFTLEESKELNLPINGTWINHTQEDSMIGVLTTSYIDLDDLIEEHGEDKAHTLFEKFRNKPPEGEPDKEFAQSIVERLPKGVAVLTRVEWALENPDSDTSLQWCQHYHFDFPTINSKGILEVGDYHYYAHVYGDDDGGETWKHQADAIEYFKETVTRLKKELT